jgi:hypothetical protein
MTVSELLSMGKGDQAVMDFMAATDVGKVLPETSRREEVVGDRAGESWPAGDGQMSKECWAFMGFIPFPLYYISATFGCCLSFVRRG